MTPATTQRSLVETAPRIIREFGVGPFVRCMATSFFSREPRSYLEMVMRLKASRRTNSALARD